MPELPEVETTVRAINAFENSILEKIVIHNRNLRWKVNKEIEKLTTNRKIYKISRRAKYIIIKLDAYYLMLHLGMSGKLRVQDKKDNFFKKHDHIEFIFKDKKKLNSLLGNFTFASEDTYMYLNMINFANIFPINY